jgi:hypothetical protein
MNLPIIPQDKANHAVYGAVIFCAVFALAHQFVPIYQAHIAAAAVMLAAFGKEAADRLANWRAARAGLPMPHGVEMMDAVATCAGGVLAALPMIILEYT